MMRQTACLTFDNVRRFRVKRFNYGLDVSLLLSLVFQVHSKIMRLLSKVLWFFAFLVATFCWMVLFEHGFSMKSFTEGVRVELQEMARKVTGGKAEPEVPSSTGTAVPPPEPANPEA